MKIKTFWMFLLKLLSFYILINSLPTIFDIISLIIFQENYYASPDYWTILASLLMTFGIYLIVFNLFMFRTSWLIEKFQLEKGFTEESIELNVHHSTVIKIGLIIFGGFLFVDTIPDFLKEGYTYFQNKDFFVKNGGPGMLLFYFVKLLTGYVLMTHSRPIVNYFEKNRRKA